MLMKKDSSRFLLAHIYQVLHAPGGFYFVFCDGAMNYPARVAWKTVLYSKIYQ